MKRAIWLGVVCFLCSSVDQVRAAPITTLFNTGVDNAGTPRLDNQSELHYSLIAGPITGTPVVTTSAGGYPIGPWIGDNSTSAWITPSMDTVGPAGTYTYRTVFDLTGFDPLSALLTGQWTTDDEGMDILINGNSLGFTTPSTAYMSGFFPFSINSGFVAGLNNLDFVVANVGGPTGLRVEMSGTANLLPAPVPEPSALLLMGSGLAGLGTWRVRNRMPA